MIIALVLTLASAGHFEVNTAGTFESAHECLTEMHALYPRLDHTRGNIFIRCISDEAAEDILRKMIGARV